MEKEVMVLKSPFVRYILIIGLFVFVVIGVYFIGKRENGSTKNFKVSSNNSKIVKKNLQGQKKILKKNVKLKNISAKKTEVSKDVNTDVNGRIINTGFNHKKVLTEENNNLEDKENKKNVVISISKPVVLAKPSKKGEFFMNPIYSPDGSVVYFTGAKYKGLYKLDKITGEIVKISDEDGIGYGAVVLPDGSIKTNKGIIDPDGVLHPEEKMDEENKLVVKDDNIYLKEKDGSITPITFGDDKYFNPKISPDGKKVVFQGLIGGLYVYDSDTGKKVKIGQGSQPVWTPDGKGVIYSYAKDDGSKLIDGDIYYASADGSVIKKITDTPDIIEENPHLSPDGTKLIWNDEEGNLYEADITIFYK